MKQFSTHVLSWALMSSHKRSFVLMCTQEHPWVWCYGAISTQECWWVLIASSRHDHDCSCALLSACCSKSSQVLKWPHDCSLVTLMRSHELGTMDQWALMSSQEQSSAWRDEAMSTHHHSWVLMAPYHHTHECSWVLMTKHECLWELMSTYGSSWVLMTGHEFWTALSNNKQKMFSFKMTSM